MRAKPLLLALAVSLAVAGTAHGGGLSVCEVDSDFDLRIADNGLEFHRDGGTPARIRMHEGRLDIDGRVQALSAADARRVAEFERKLRALVPEVKLIALDAVELAFGAVVQVAEALGGPDRSRVDALVERLEDVRIAAVQRIDGAVDTADWNDGALEAQVEALVGELVPVIAGEAASIAIAAAMSGDEAAAAALERRMERMGKDIEAHVEQRAAQLEARAEALCPRVAELDAIDNALELRLADNRPLDLLVVRR